MPAKAWTQLIEAFNVVFANGQSIPLRLEDRLRIMNLSLKRASSQVFANEEFFAKSDLPSIIRSDDKALVEKALNLCKNLLKKSQVSMSMLFGED